MIRGLSLLVLIGGLLFTGFLYQQNMQEKVNVDRGEPVTQQFEQQTKDILQQYQKRLDQQAANQ